MASISATDSGSAGTAALLQILGSSGSPLASTFSSPTLQAALKNASPADIVQLSDATLQAQSLDALFGTSSSDSGSSGSGFDLPGASTNSTADSLLQTLQANSTASANAASPTSNATSLLNLLG